MMPIWLAIVIMLVLAAACLAIGYRYRLMVAEKEISSAEEEAKRILKIGRASCRERVSINV